MLQIVFKNTKKINLTKKKSNFLRMIRMPVIRLQRLIIKSRLAVCLVKNLFTIQDTNS